MALNATQVRVAGTGKVYIGPALASGASPVTTDIAKVDVALAATWKELGYVTEDGVNFAFNRETSDLNAWQGSKLRVLTTGEPKSVEFALMQTSTDVMLAAFGGGTVTEVTAATAASGSAGSPGYTPAKPAVMKFVPPKGSNAERQMVIEFTDDTTVYRYYFPRVQQEGEISFSLTKAGAVTYPITFGALDYDPAFEIYTNDAALTATP
ncbi:MAG: hypothetical protein ACO28P_01375 [Ilumatobacteraceae bacterium]